MPSVVSTELSRQYDSAVYGTFAKIADRSAALEKEGLVAQCMASKGFVYVPFVAPEAALPSADLIDLYNEAGGLDRMSQEFRERFGYGETTLRAYLTLSWERDPNFDYLSTLSQSAYRQFQEALLGVEPYAALEVGESILEPGGCVGESLRSSGAADEESQQELFRLRSTLEEAEQRLQASPVYQEGLQEWRACVGRSGYPFLSPGEISDFWRVELEAIDEHVRPDAFDIVIEGPDPEEEAGDVPVFGSEFLDPPSGSPYPPEELARLQEREIKMSLELLPCDRAFAQSVFEEETKVTFKVADELGFEFDG